MNYFFRHCGISVKKLMGTGSGTCNIKTSRQFKNSMAAAQLDEHFLKKTCFPNSVVVEPNWPVRPQATSTSLALH